MHWTMSGSSRGRQSNTDPTKGAGLTTTHACPGNARKGETRNLFYLKTTRLTVGSLHTSMPKDTGSRPQTAVYVTGLPADATVDELHAYFNRAGVVMDDLIRGGPRIKIYSKPVSSAAATFTEAKELGEDNREGVEQGGKNLEKAGKEKEEVMVPTGDALVVYLRPESVDLACTLFDESALRPDVVIRVQPAEAKHHDTATDPTKDESKDSSIMAKDKKISKETWKHHMQAMKKKLEWWDSEEVVPSRTAAVTAVPQGSFYNRIVILRGMFDAATLAADPSLILDLKKDIEDECLAKLGATKIGVQVFEESEDGMCSVKFREQLQASACVRLMNGRRYDGRRVAAQIYDGSFSLRKNKKEQTIDEEAADRLERFGEWLECQSEHSDEAPFLDEYVDEPASKRPREQRQEGVVERGG